MLTSQLSKQGFEMVISEYPVIALSRNLPNLGAVAQATMALQFPLLLYVCKDTKNDNSLNQWLQWCLNLVV
jgi:hypothetical protein